MNRTYIALLSIIIVASQLKAQTFSNEEIYEYNTATSISYYFISLKKYKCAKKVIDDIDKNLINKIYRIAPKPLHYKYAELFLLNGDSIQSEKYFLKYISENG